jgi:hypothetical protein
MSINSVISSGVQGVQAGIGRANQAAGQIASVGAEVAGGDLAASIVDLKLGEIQVKASASVIRAGNEMLGSLIDINA